MNVMQDHDASLRRLAGAVAGTALILLGLNLATAQPMEGVSANPSRTLVAQAGSTGGTIGKRGRSLSGTAEQPRSEPSRPKKSATRKAVRTVDRTPAVSSSHDGSWSVATIKPTKAGCVGFDMNLSVSVAEGRISGSRISGRVDRNGNVRAAMDVLVDTLQAQGRLGRGSGGGTWTDSKGCTGRWTARRQ